MKQNLPTKNCPLSLQLLRKLTKPGMRGTVVLFLVLLLTNFSTAQITFTQNSNSGALSQMLVGAGVTISNVTMNCNANASGTFTNTNSNLGLTQGIVMATGKVTSIPQAASNFASTSLTGTGDAQLSTLTTGTIYDPCILEFDIVPQGDTLSFKYVFASEEYPQFVCSQFNDVFGFFITGPNPVGGSFTNKNIATLPNSTMPVCINSVNDGVSGTYNGTTWNSNGCMSLGNTNYYVNNITPTVNPNIVYNGMTTVLSAVSAVVPCQKYHLKIAIADVGDRLYDSGVMLQAYSITSTPYNVTITSAIDNTAYTSAYRGCMNGKFTVSIAPAQTSPVTVAVNVSGTAVNGVDYSTLPSTVTIPAGQTSVTLPLTALVTGVASPAETVTLSVLNLCSGLPSTSATITILDPPADSLTVNDTTLCIGQSAQFNATGGVSYLWTPATGLSSTTIANPVATPDTTTTYTVNITLGTCVHQLSKTIYVSEPVGISFNPGDTVCIGSMVQLTASANGGIPYNYVWSTGASGNSITTSVGGAYSVTGTNSYGCSASATKNLVELNPTLTATPTAVTCFGGNSGSIAVSPSGGVTPYTYGWSNASTAANLTNVIAGTYKVTATDAKGCTASATANITQPGAALHPVVTTTTNVSCFAGNNGSINVNVTGGTPAYIYNWNAGVTTQNRTGLSAGTYNLTVTDSKGCTASVAATITQPASALSASTNITNVNCFAGNTGVIIVLPNGGTAPYTYNWGGGITSQARASLTAGTYDVTTTDATGCSVSTVATVTQPTTALAVTANPTGVTCYGNHNGSINLNVSGGTVPYFYSWNDGASIENIANLAGGTYQVTVTDAQGCQATAAALVSQQASALAATATASGVTCFGSNNGVINLTVTGGTIGYTYNWTGGVTTQNRTGLSAGTYGVTATDSKGCTVTAVATITQPTTTLSASTNITGISCFGGNTGVIILLPSGGTAPYSYNWGGGVTSQNRASLTSGTYNATVTDANGCSIGVTAVVTQPAAALAATATPTDVACFGNHTGSIGLTVAGGTTPYFYSWNNGASIQNIANLASGAYSVTVTDAQGCSTSATTNVTQPASALTATATVNNVNCFGSNNGTINLTATGGTVAYAYNWTGGALTQNLTNLTAGTYNVTVTDSKGCTATAAAAITQPGAPLLLTTTSTNINCFGGNTGTINVYPTGGTTPYTYNWGGGITTQNRSSLAAGIYNVTVSDANACSVSIATTITQPAATLAATATPTAVACFGNHTGNVNLNVSGGTTAYSYVWSNGATIQNITNLASGTYKATVTDALGCSTTVSTSVTQPSSALTASSNTTNVSCFGANNGSVNLTVSGGTAAYTYSWTGGATTQNISNIIGGTYDVTVTDSKGCSATAGATIAQPSGALAAIATTTNVNCFAGNNGAITLAVTGGTTPYAYNWGGGITTQNRASLAAGTYSVTITDGNACSISATTTITQPVAALGAIPTPTAVACFGNHTGCINLNVSGGTTPYAYSWTNGSTVANIVNLGSGPYTVSVTDAKGCSAVASANIAQPAGALAAATTVNNVSCFGSNDGTINLTVSGGTVAYTYNWTGGATIQNLHNLVSGTYDVTVTDSKGCSATAGGAITQPSGALAAIATTTNVNCFAGNNAAITLAVTGGTTPYVYNWGGGITTQNRASLAAGTYSVTITDGNACSISTTTTITQPAAALAASTTPTAVACFGNHTGSINLNVSGGTTPYAYSWTNGSTVANIVTLGSGSYTVSVTDAKGCSAVASANIAQPAGALAASTTVNNVSCFGSNNGTINLTVSGGTVAYTYNWTGGVTTQNRTNLTAGTYNVTITDSKGCSATTTANVTQPAAALSASAVITNIKCFGGNTGAISITPAGGTTPYAYNWGGGITSQNRASLAAGTYTVTITDANACSVSVSGNVTQPVAVLSATATPGAVACFGNSTGNISLNVNGGTTPYNFSWTNGASTASISNVLAGSYAVTVTDANGCSVSTGAAITQPAGALTASTSNGNVNCFGSTNGNITLTVAGGTPAYTYNWGTGVTSQNRSNLSAGIYAVTVTDTKGCTATSSATVYQPMAALSANAAITNAVCFGGNTGIINLAVTGGTTPYTYSWNGGVTSQNRASLYAGNYNVSVADANGCSITGTYTISQPPALNTVATPSPVSCFGGHTGSVTVQVSGGTAPYQYLWTNGATIQNIANLVAGNYYVSVTDAVTCLATAGATVAQPASALAASAVASNVGCYGSGSGTINLAATGGTATYNYNWNDGASTPNRANLTAGNYNVTVTDSKSCVTTVSVAITQPSGALTGTTTVTHVNCFGGNTGAINLVVSGGTAPYAYNWGGGIISPNRYNLNAGTYVVTVTDANGCVVVLSSIVNQPSAPLSATSEYTWPVLCFGGNTGGTQLSVTGGTAPYNFNWSNGSSSQSLSNIVAGNYNVSVTDANLCSATANAVIAQPTAALSTSGVPTAVSCYGGNTGAINLNIAGGTNPYSFNWNDGNASQNRSNLTGGTYNVTVTDANGCSSTLNNVVSQPQVALSATLTPANVKCFGASTGSINLEVTGGTAPYLYNWGGGVATQNRSQLTAGNYSVTVSDAHSCSTTAASIVARPAAPLSIATVYTWPVICFGGNTGVINLQANGGTSPYNYTWGNGAGTANLTNLRAGVYTATVTDANSCKAVITDTIAQPASAVNATATINNVSCHDSSTGSIIVNASGGTTPYVFNWNDGANTFDRSNLTAGNYVVTVLDANACAAVVSPTVTQPGQPIRALAAVTNVRCNPGSDGAVNLNVSGGTPPYTYKWQGGPVTENRTQLTAGTYQVSITDANECMLVQFDTVTMPAPITMSLNSTAVLCYNGNSGGITLAASGGTAPYTYNWGNGLNAQNPSQLGAGNYVVTLTDAHSCTSTASATVTQPQAAVIANAIPTPVTCFGGNNGAIQLTMSGGNAPYAFNWAGGGTAQNRSNLSAGAYHVSVTDHNGCNTVASATITQPAAALSVTATATGVNCYGRNTGAVNLAVGGGTAPYNYNWSSGQTTKNVGNLTAGNYSVSVSDANGCSIASTTAVIQPAAALGATLATGNVKCFGGNSGYADLTVTGGTSPYTYIWSSGSNGQDIQNVAAGTYHVTITDSKSCSATVLANISQPVSSISAIITDNNVSCHGGNNGSLNLTVTGGTSPYSYNWGAGVTTQNRGGLTAGNYTVTVSDANSCTAVAHATVIQPASGITVASAETNVSCHNGTNGAIQLTVSGGTSPYSYNWGGGVTTQNRANLANGNYIVTVTDNKGCSATATASITQPQSGLVPSITGQTNVNCYNGNNGAIQMTVTGGTSPYTFHWTNGSSSENAANLGVGSYKVTITDHNGCVAIDSAKITGPNAALTATVATTEVKCKSGDNGTIALTVTGGTPNYTYNWGGGVTSENRNGLAAGGYTVTVTDHNQCKTVATATVTQPANSVNISDAVTALSCFNSDNGKINLTVTGGSTPYSYNWGAGIVTQNRSNLNAGSYSVTVTDANGCSTKAAIAVTAPDSIKLADSYSGPSCYGLQDGKIQVTATGGTPGYTYNWNTGGNTAKITNLVSGPYAVTVSDAHGCTASLTNIVLIQPLPLNLGVNVVSGACANLANGDLAAVVTGGSSPYLYHWGGNQSTPSISNLNVGNYTVTVTDAHQCSQTANALVNAYPGVEGNGVTGPLPCQNAKGEIQMFVTSGTGPFTYRWNDGDTTQNLYGVHPGTYSVTVKDANGCSFDTTFTIDNLNSFNVQATGVATIVLGASTEIHATSDGSNQTVFNWTPASTLSCATCPNAVAGPVQTTTYTVVGIDTNGCTASDTVSVIVIEDHDIFVPNAFTPNGDGNNDVFQIFGNLAGIHSIEVKIFDRWGEKVFESESPTFQWDGTYRGVMENPNVFVYEMKIVFDDGNVGKLKKGSITLIR